MVAFHVSQYARIRMCSQADRWRQAVQACLNCYGSGVAELTLERPVDTPAHVVEDPSVGLDRIGLALAEPIRRAVLVRLLDGTECPSDLADAIGTSRSNLSNHLACLRGCGLIRARRAGRHLHYDLVSEQLADALRSLLAVASTLSDCDEHDSTTSHLGRRP
jgi:DNA-binding transcriptional ArsR family regulator